MRRGVLIALGSLALIATGYAAATEAGGGRRSFARVVADAAASGAVENQPPSIVVPTEPIVVEATGPDGAAVVYDDKVSASDPEDGALTPKCTPSSGSTFSIGTTTVECTVKDSGNLTDSEQFTVTVQDTTPPSFSAVQNLTVAPTSTAGAVVNYTPPTATDLVDGTVSVTCDPAPKSTFPIGLTTVTCTATDSHGNPGKTTFSVTVQDASAPVVTVPASEIIEANGPEGSKVTYPAATAVDQFGTPLPVSCEPPAGSLFPIGTTTVVCTAKDALGHTGQASFTITVEDTTPPVLTVPCNLTIESASPVPATDPAVASFLGGATAADIVDPAPTVTNDAPSSFPVGTTTVTFTAEDRYGNETSQAVTVTVGPDVEAAACNADRLPPGNVRNVRARTGNLSVAITWSPPPDRDFDHVEITRTIEATARGPTAATDAPTLVYTGTGTRFVDRGLTDSVQYRYVIVSLDKAGNRSPGVAVIALAHRQALLSPGNGAIVRRPPLIRWQKVQGATYYNLQLWRNGKKILSAWPRKPSYQVRAQWRFNRRTQRLTSATYAVYVWPGFGRPAAGRYGRLIVEATFVYRR